MQDYKPQDLPCLNCGQAANPELKFCPVCEHRLGFNIVRDRL